MAETTEAPVRPVSIGDPVRVVDEQRRKRYGLVTAVHGTFGGAYVPCINVVLVSPDTDKVDPYGRQLDARMSSLQHYSAGPNGMPMPGRYWENLLQ